MGTGCIYILWQHTLEGLLNRLQNAMAVQTYHGMPNPMLHREPTEAARPNPIPDNTSIDGGRGE